MKKYFLSITAVIVLGIAVVSCQNNNTKETEKKDSASVNKNSDVSVPTETSKNESLPVFQNTEVTQYCKDYKILIDEYVDALNNNKSVNESELSDKMREITLKADDLKNKLKPEEVKVFAAFMASMSNQLVQASMKNAQNKK